MNSQHNQVRLWLCADLNELAPEQIVARTRLTLALRASFTRGVWLRGVERLAARPLLDCALALRALTDAHCCSLMIAQRADIAALAHADFVHCTRNSMNPSQTRSILARLTSHTALRLSASVHSWRDDTLTHGCEQYVLGPIGVVPEKGPPLSASEFTAIRRHAPSASLVAVGGFGPHALEPIKSVCALGANAIAVRRAFVRDDVQTSLPPIIEQLELCFSNFNT
jgi:thiamine monophosphate synthase